MPKPKSKRAELAARLTQSIWWAPSLDRSFEQTGVAHAIHEGVALCGAQPHSMGATFAFAMQANCRECERCRQIIRDVQRIRNEMHEQLA